MQKTVQNAAVSPLDRGPVTSGGPNMDSRLMRPFIPDEAVDRGSPAENVTPTAKAPALGSPLIPVNPDEFRGNKELKAKAFHNDLTPERKEQLVAQFAEQVRSELENDRLSVNFVARLVNRQHRQVSSLLLSTTSATEAIAELQDKTGKCVDRLLAKLTPEQKEQMLKKLQNG